MREPSEQTARMTAVRGILLVRVVVIALLMVLMGWAERSGGLGVHPGPLMALLLGLWALCLLHLTGRPIGPSLGVLLGGQILLDLVIETILVVGTGGTGSPLVLLYSLTIFTAAMYLRRRGAFFAALGAFLAFAGVAVTFGTDGVPLAVPHVYWELGIHGGAFFALALFAGILAHGSRRSRAEAVSATEELQRVVTSTDRIFEHMPIGLMTADASGHIVRTNRAARDMLNVDADRILVGEDLGAFFEPLAPQLVEAVESVLLTRKWSIREEILIARGARKAPIGVSVTPLLLDGETLEEVIVTITDLRDVRRMEQEMFRAEQLANLGELAAGVAHEIRNPLASISGAVQVLRSEWEGDGEEAELMDLIVRESDRLNRTIEGVLDYTRDHSATREVHDVSTTVREVVRLLHHDRRLSMGKTVLMEFPPDQSFFAQVEEAGMKQVFFNLARNALEAMGVGGILRITGENPGSGRLFVVFRDTGVGIEPHELESVFKPFHTTKQGGTGLGLSIASRIVEGNGGTIQIKSTPGMGTAITVELPARSPSSRSSHEPDEPNTHGNEPERTYEATH
jgi:two-component system sensor histidine kinase PilS (NtrC family)